MCSIPCLPLLAASGSFEWNGIVLRGSGCRKRACEWGVKNWRGACLFQGAGKHCLNCRWVNRDGSRPSTIRKMTCWLCKAACSVCPDSRCILLIQLLKLDRGLSFWPQVWILNDLFFLLFTGLKTKKRLLKGVNSVVLWCLGRWRNLKM